MQARTSEACHRGESRWKGIGVSNSEIHALPATARGKLLMTQVLALGGEKAARALLTLLGSPAPQLVGTQPCAGGATGPGAQIRLALGQAQSRPIAAPSLVGKVGHRERCGQPDMSPLGTGSRSRALARAGLRAPRHLYESWQRLVASALLAWPLELAHPPQEGTWPRGLLGSGFEGGETYSDQDWDSDQARVRAPFRRQ